MSWTSQAEGLIRFYDTAAADAPRPALLWLHGGGFAGGSIDMPEADAVARGLAARGIAVASVDYRLAGPGTRYPAPSDDAVAAWHWFAAHLEALHLDPSRTAIGGASAGGNLAAGALLRLPHPGPRPAAAVLAYPTLLAVQPLPGPALRAALDADPDADRFGPDVVRAMYEGFLGGPVERAPLAAVPGTASPEDLAGYPPVLMVNGDVDELRVSGEHFARLLHAAGRPVLVHLEPGTTHGHLNRPGEAAFGATLERIAAYLHGLPVTAVTGLPVAHA
ncbi:alpha/beta hydrolase [Arenivirga flava]|uniref:Esterase n=1 Tax=Arenivirga flava TaxID=1930060 RepID=A0AA37XB16_9MICO|nr:alpha/beta hydrolase fold domain-containing protein [Arenivirga flava]GMA27901.1 esterase [Arenivirga flava]